MTPDVLNAPAAVLATYALHSSLLLGGVWLLDRRGRIASHVLRETLWKAAALAPMLTTAIACLGGWTRPVTEFALGPTTGASEVVTQPAGDSYSVESSNESDAARPFKGGTITTEVSGAESSSPGSGASLPSDAARREEAIVDSLLADARGGVAPSLEASSESTNDIPAAATDDDVDSGAKFEDPPPTVRAASPPAMTPSAAGVLRAFLDLLVLVAASLLPVGLVICLLRAARLSRRYADGEVMASGTAREALDELCCDAHIRHRVQLLSRPRVFDPVAYGLFRWTIVLPRDAWQRLDRQQLKALLAHELAHLVRGDVVWLWLGQILCTCFAWQPLNFLARRRWQTAAEYQCDDWAIERGVEPLSLAACLTEVASWRIENAAPDAGLTATGRSEVGRRIRRLAEGVVHDRWRSKLRGASLRIALLLLTLAFGWRAPRAVWSVAAPMTSASEHSSTLPVEFGESSAVEAAEGEPEVDAHAIDTEMLEQWRKLNAELRQLHDAIKQLPEPAEDDADPRVDSLIRQLKQRAARLESRRMHLIDRLGDAVASPDANSLDDAFGDVNLTTP